MAVVWLAVWSERRRLATLWRNSPIHRHRVIESPPLVMAPSSTPNDRTLGESHRVYTYDFLEWGGVRVLMCSSI